MDTPNPTVDSRSGYAHLTLYQRNVPPTSAHGYSGAAVEPSSPTRKQEESLTVLQVGAMSFGGVLLLMLIATLFLGVTVYPSVHWFLHWPESGKVARAVVGSFHGAAALSAIIMTGTVVRDCFYRFYRT